MDAQARADRIAAFREELAEVERVLGSMLAPDDRERLDRHHQVLLATLRREYDVDATTSGHQLSLGMRIASLLGAVALSVGLVLAVAEFWGLLVLPVQLLLLLAPPSVAILITDRLARRTDLRYFTQLAAVVAWVLTILGLSVLGSLFNRPPTPAAFLVWGGVALALAHAYQVPLLGFLGGGALAIGGAGMTLHLADLWWPDLVARPELVFPWALGLLAVARWRQTSMADGLASAGVVLGAFAAFLLGLDGRLSFLPMPRAVVEASYDALALFGLVGMLWLAIRRQWTLTRTMATGGIALLLFLKVFDWWYAVLPRYLFFLLVGGLALGVLAALRRARRRLEVGR